MRRIFADTGDSLRRFPLAAQRYRPNPLAGEEKSANVSVLGIRAVQRVRALQRSDIEMEQELSRPYGLSRSANEAGKPNPTIGFDIISIKVPTRRRSFIPGASRNPELHRGPGSLAPTYIKTHGQYYSSWIPVSGRRSR